MYSNVCNKTGDRGILANANKCEFDGSFSKSLANSLEGVLFGEEQRNNLLSKFNVLDFRSGRLSVYRLAFKSSAS